jgi:Zn-dependent protease
MTTLRAEDQLTSSEHQSNLPEWGRWRLTSISFLLFTLSWYLLGSMSIWSTIGFSAIFACHELGHWSAARALDIDVRPPVFLPFLGGFVIFDDESSSDRQKLLVALSGPMAGFAAADVTLCAGHAFANADAMAVGVVGILVHLLNLLPLPGLDGGFLVRGFTPWFYVVGVVSLVAWVTLRPVSVGFWIAVGMIVIILLVQTVARGRTAWHDPQRRRSPADYVGLTALLTLVAMHAFLLAALVPPFIHDVWARGL